MVSRVSLQNIIDADWSKQYLTSAGTVESRGFCSRIVTFLRQAPYIGALFAAFLPRPDMFKASDAIRREIKDLLTNGSTTEDAVITAAAAKVNELVYKIAQKRPKQAEVWDDAIINVKELIVVQPRVEPIVEPVQEPVQQPVQQPVQEPVQEPIAIQQPEQAPAEVVEQPAAEVAVEDALARDDNQLPDLMVLDDLEPNQGPALVEVQLEEVEVPAAAPQLSAKEFPTLAEAHKAQKLSSRLAVEAKKRHHKEKKTKAVAAAPAQPAQEQVVASAPKKKSSHRHTQKKL